MEPSVKRERRNGVGSTIGGAPVTMSATRRPAPFIRRYADRMGGIHIKDCFPDYLSPQSRAGMSYSDVQATKPLQ